ncbi:hypothetical protein GCM10010116_32780 [Microbispora rosea subsp. aerata]|nr:hypothetical protein GCM10010116_32780 [Microbispora rosea subsp. aerata]GIH55881.1 hypothetical protein Mro02_27950 [Microbispora rosea subsp. aerata]GLJ83205.1 hypothetical protein GCM10017588_19320 [Microbispora rosea subsp. aerata]
MTPPPGREDPGQGFAVSWVPSHGPLAAVERILDLHGQTAGFGEISVNRTAVAAHADT